MPDDPLAKVSSDSQLWTKTFTTKENKHTHKTVKEQTFSHPLFKQTQKWVVGYGSNFLWLDLSKKKKKKVMFQTFHLKSTLKIIKRHAVAKFSLYTFQILSVYKEEKPNF